MTILYFITDTIFSSSSLFLIFTIVILIIIIKRYNSNKNKEYWLKRNIRVGETPAIAKTIKGANFHLIDQELVKNYGKVFGVYRFGSPTIFCSDPPLVSNILSKDFSYFRNRRWFYFNDELMDNALNLLHDDKWKRMRSIISPTFSSGKLRKMRPIIDECVQTLINDFDRIIKESNEIDVKTIFSAFAMNAIARVAFGTKVDALGDQSNPLLVNAKLFLSKDFKLLDLPKLIFLSKFPKIGTFLNLRIHSRKACEFFKGLTKKLLDDRRSSDSKLKRYDFLQLVVDAMDNDNDDEKLLYDSADNNIDNDGELFQEYKFTTQNKKLSVVEITAQCGLFFRAGFEPTSATLSYVAYNLACHSHVQQILYEEVKGVFDSQSELDYDLIHSLKYTDAVISETLRLYPSATSLERTASEDYILDNNIKIFKGDIIRIPVYSMHRDSQYFAEPQLFKPERFFAENRSHHPYAYLPFGAGPRNCVARRLALLEVKLAVLYLVNNFKFSVTDKTEHPPQTYSNAGLLFPRAVLLRVEKR